MQISLRVIFLGILLPFFQGCTSNVGTNPPLDEVEVSLQALLDEATKDSYNSISGVSMTVMAPELGIQWSGSTGYGNSERTEKLQAEYPFRIASVTKTFVATAIVKLHELGRLNVDDSIEGYISEEHKDMLINGGYAPDSILIRHCLNHTSGLLDYAMTGRTYSDLCKKDPGKRWTRTEQLQLAMDIGDRVGYPGEKYRYGDTGYILLGEIIENLTESDLGSGLRELLRFEKLEMDNTWLESIGPQVTGPHNFVERYFRGMKATDFDPSVDLYGGGGLVSTTEDLTKFIYAVFNKGIFESKLSLKEMIAKPVYDPDYDIAKDERYKDYRSGIWRIKVYGHDAYMHAGLWGTILIYIPDLKCAISINYTDGMYDRLLKKTILVVHNINKEKR